MTFKQAAEILNKYQYNNCENVRFRNGRYETGLFTPSYKTESKAVEKLTERINRLIAQEKVPSDILTNPEKYTSLSV